MRSLAVILGLLLAALAALDWATWPERTERGAGAPLFPELVPERANRLRVQLPGEAPLLVQRGASGWVLPESDGFPADDWFVDQLLAALARQGQGQRVARAPADPGDFGLGSEVGAAGALLEVRDDAGRVQVQCEFGQQAAGGAAIEGVYLRPIGDTAVYRAPLVPQLTADPASWMRTRLLSLDLARLRGLTVNLAGQRSASFRRSEAGHWTVDGAEAPEVALDRLAAAAGQLFHSGPVASEPSAEHGLDPALIELQFTLLAAGDEATADSAPEQLVTLRIGREDADGASFATQSDWARPWVVRLTAGALEELLVALTEVVERSAFR